MTDLDAVIRSVVREEIAKAEVRGTPARVVTVREAADRLSVDQRTVRRLIQRGELRGIRVGSRSLRVVSADIDRILDEAVV